MKNKTPVIIAPNGNQHQVPSIEEAVRTLAIIANGYLDVDPAKLTKDLLDKEIESYKFGGWELRMVSEVEVQKPAITKYMLTKGDKSETVSSAEAIAHICDCSINTVSKRLAKDPKGFTVKGWKIAKLDGAQ